VRFCCGGCVAPFEAARPTISEDRRGLVKAQLLLPARHLRGDGRGFRWQQDIAVNPSTNFPRAVLQRTIKDLNKDPQRIKSDKAVA
jgi:hypothetical protein